MQQFQTSSSGRASAGDNDLEGMLEVEYDVQQ